jgi:hypothetical protein
MIHNNRIVKYDLLRALAIISNTIFLHATEFALEKWKYYSLVSTFLSLVPQFFIVAGALNMPVSNGTSWLKHRLKAIMPPMILWSIIYFVLTCKYDTTKVPLDLFYNGLWVFYGPTFGAGYFVYTLIGLYILAIIISPWLKIATQRNFLILIGIWLCSGLCNYSELYIYAQPHWQTTFGIFYGNFGFLLVGYYFKRFPLRNETTKRKIIMWSVVAFFGVFVSCRYWVSGCRYGFADKIHDWLTINGMAWNILVFMIIDQWDNIPDALSRVITWLGKRAYGIFLAYTLILKYVINSTIFLPSVTFLHPTGWWQLFLLTFGLTLGLVTTLSYLPFSNITVGVRKEKRPAILPALPTSVAGTDDNILVGGDFWEAHRSASMQPLSGDTNLGTKSKLGAVSKRG